MIQRDDLEELEGRRICHGCIGESFLSAEIERTGTRGRCHYCGKSAKSVSIGDFSLRVERAFEEHYIRTSDQPDAWQERLQADKELDYEWSRTGDFALDAIADAADISEDAASDVLAILADKHESFDKDALGEEGEFAQGSCYERKLVSSGAWQEEWR